MCGGTRLLCSGCGGDDDEVKVVRRLVAGGGVARRRWRGFRWCVAWEGDDGGDGGVTVVAVAPAVVGWPELARGGAGKVDEGDEVCV
ncbi:hypothetical protein Tco_0944468 [Tanacetum coccineum]